MYIWTSLSQQMPAYLQDFGVFVLFAVIMFEAGGLPVPGETALITAAVLTSAGKLNLLHVAAAAIAGAIVGDNIGYAIGRYAGRDAVVQLFARFGVSRDKLDHAEARLLRHGMPLVAAARFFPVLRQVGGIGAGTIGMTWLRFLAANTTGAVCWVGFWLSAVRVFESGIATQLMAWSGSRGHRLLLICSTLVFLLVVAMLVTEIRRRRRGG